MTNESTNQQDERAAFEREYQASWDDPAMDDERKHFCLGWHAALQAQASGQAVALLAPEHKGMTVDYSGMLMQAANALVCGEKEPGLAEMLRQLQGHMTELGLRWYAGDVAVVDELLQLYCIGHETRAMLAAAPQPPAALDQQAVRDAALDEAMAILEAEIGVARRCHAPAAVLAMDACAKRIRALKSTNGGAA